jgi:hypothetical protein
MAISEIGESVATIDCLFALLVGDRDGPFGHATRPAPFDAGRFRS